VWLSWVPVVSLSVRGDEDFDGAVRRRKLGRLLLKRLNWIERWSAPATSTQRDASKMQSKRMRICMDMDIGLCIEVIWKRTIGVRALDHA